eukprot:TRINITY_DN45370_c0_g1_i1.p1 TRINITY_DN45370_c0_g1~~TRINITY_DN45370_c0_g1_i1.p1  ORF type:complete len:125 (-),score=40.85 TRINITY_DN45370_c0_g1_i1:257-631(-)
MKTARELREEGQKSLLRNLDQQRTELADLRVSAQTSGAASRLARIKVVRKSIARILTVMSQKQNTALRTNKKYYKGKKHKPRYLRPKLTHAIRVNLKPHEMAARTLKQKKQAAAFPQRKFAIQL